MKAPERIYLQVSKTEEDDDWDDEVGVTWCVDRINDTDAEYVRDEIHTLTKCAVPSCDLGVRPRDAVGGMCVPHAEAELERLRGIEAAVLDGDSREESGGEWRKWAAWFAGESMPEHARAGNAIADALAKEAKP